MINFGIGISLQVFYLVFIHISGINCKHQLSNKSDICFFSKWSSARNSNNCLLIARSEFQMLRNHSICFRKSRGYKLNLHVLVIHCPINYEIFTFKIWWIINCTHCLQRRCQLVATVRYNLFIAKLLTVYSSNQWLCSKRKFSSYVHCTVLHTIHPYLPSIRHTLA